MASIFVLQLFTNSKPAVSISLDSPSMMYMVNDDVTGKLSYETHTAISWITGHDENATQWEESDGARISVSHQKTVWNQEKSQLHQTEIPTCLGFGFRYGNIWAVDCFNFLQIRILFCNTHQLNHNHFSVSYKVCDFRLHHFIRCNRVQPRHCWSAAFRLPHRR